MREPDDILFDGAETYEKKQSDYGDSWRKIGYIFHLLANGHSIELETVEDHISYGLFTRRMDKIARAFNGEFLADEMNYESIEDAHEDESVYAAMAASNQSQRKRARVGVDEPDGDGSAAPDIVDTDGICVSRDGIATIKSMSIPDGDTDA